MGREIFDGPSKPSAIEEARMALWEKPAPTTRDQYLERKDLKHEIDVLVKDDYMRIHKAGYAKIMNLRGATREELE